MIINQKVLPRRTVLRGMGVSLMLPMLDAMTPPLSASASVKAAAQPAPRLGFFYAPNGTYPPNFFPKTAGKGFEFTPVLKPLEPFREYVNVLSGLSNVALEDSKVGGGIHTRCGCSWLSGLSPLKTEGTDLRAGTSIDQMAAAVIGKDSPLTSLQMALDYDYLVGSCDFGYSCIYRDTFSWKTPTTPMPMESNPRSVFERLFGDGGSAAERLAQLRENRSVLDRAMEEIGRLHKRLGPGDRHAVTEYLDSVRGVEQRIQRAEKNNATAEMPLFDAPVGIPDSFDEHAKLMFDLLFLAYWADITRVGTFQMSRELSPRAYPWIGVSEAHHSQSHHQLDPEKIGKLTKVNAYHISLFARLIEKMRDTPDGGGSLLDHSMMMFGWGFEDGDHHNPRNLPVVTAGRLRGQLEGGRHLAYTLDTPFMNVGVSLLNKVGVQVERIADSTGPLGDL